MSYDLAPLLAELRGHADEKYRQFNEGLTPGAEGRSLGVRVPKLRAIARAIPSAEADAFLDATLFSDVHELKLLHAMVLAKQKTPWEAQRARIRAFVPTLDNWAVCDIFCGDLKPKADRLEPLMEMLKGYCASDREFEVRFGYVMLMDYYHSDPWIEQTLALYAAFRHDGYYARMGVAWGLATLLVHQRERTIAFLRQDDLDRFTHNKAIQKACESYRVSEADKQFLRTLRR